MCYSISILLNIKSLQSDQFGKNLLCILFIVNHTSVDQFYPLDGSSVYVYLNHHVIPRNVYIRRRLFSYIGISVCAHVFACNLNIFRENGKSAQFRGTTREALRASKSEEPFRKLRFASRGQGMPRKVCKIGESESRYSQGKSRRGLDYVRLCHHDEENEISLDSFFIEILARCTPILIHNLIVITSYYRASLRFGLLVNNIQIILYFFCTLFLGLSLSLPGKIN